MSLPHFSDFFTLRHREPHTFFLYSNTVTGCASYALFLQGFLGVLGIYFGALLLVMLNVVRSSMAVTSECMQVGQVQHLHLLHFTACQ